MSKSFLDQIGERMQYLREYKGYTVREVAKMCGVSYCFVVNVENGRQKAPYSFYEDYCIQIGITTGDLFRCFRWTHLPQEDRKVDHSNDNGKQVS